MMSWCAQQSTDVAGASESSAMNRRYEVQWGNIIYWEDMNPEDLEKKWGGSERFYSEWWFRLLNTTGVHARRGLVNEYMRDNDE